MVRSVVSTILLIAGPQLVTRATAVSFSPEFLRGASTETSTGVNSPGDAGPDTTPDASASTTDLSRLENRFRATNQALLTLDEAIQVMAPETRDRIEPVIEVLSEELGEVAGQITAVEMIQAQSVTPAKNVSPDVFTGIQSDLAAINTSVEKLSRAIRAIETY